MFERMKFSACRSFIAAVEILFMILLFDVDLHFFNCNCSIVGTPFFNVHFITPLFTIFLRLSAFQYIDSIEKKSFVLKNGIFTLPPPLQGLNETNEFFQYFSRIQHHVLLRFHYKTEFCRPRFEIGPAVKCLC